ncbi:MAG: PAS domain S-box protein [Opitutae bacterium]|nr:PAS domain S-box protein [Opitutae bacterium]
MNPSAPIAPAPPLRLPRLAALLALATGSAVLLGWTFDLAFLKSVLPGFVTMKANTAVGFMLLGGALWLRVCGARVIWAARFCAGLTVILGALTLSEYVAGRDLGIDQLFFTEPPGTIGTLAPGRMAPASAINFILLGSVLLWSGSTPASAVAFWVALLAGVLGFLPLVGYLYGTSRHYGVGHYSQLALHTTVLFVVLSFGVMRIQVQAGFVRLATSSTLGGWLVRRLAAFVVGIPLAVGGLLTWAEQYDLVENAFGGAVMTVATMLLLAGAIWRFASLLNQNEVSRREAEMNERRSAERYRRLVKLAPLPLAIVDQAGTTSYVNDRFSKTFGYTRDDIPTQAQWWQLAYPEEEYRLWVKAIWEEAVTKAIRENVDIEASEYVVTCKDGTVRIVEISGVVLGDEVLVTLFDITERARAEQQAQAAQAETERLLALAEQSRRVLLSLVEDQKRAEEEIRALNTTLEQRVAARTAQLELSNKELEAFSYSVSHDLRAPLRGIDGWSMALLNSYGDRLDETAHKYLGRVRSETQRMGQLIDDLLKLARVTRTAMHADTVDFSAVAQGIAQRLLDGQPERAMVFDIAPDLTVQGDAALLEIALTNLLDNAAKFTGRCAQPRITFGRLPPNTAGELVFFVRDNGAGFDMDYAEKLFGAFQRMHKTSEFPGTGIGLATVQRIVHRHGGRIWAESRPGQGATFYFTLPGNI